MYKHVPPKARSFIMSYFMHMQNSPFSKGIKLNKIYGERCQSWQNTETRLLIYIFSSRIWNSSYTKVHHIYVTVRAKTRLVRTQTEIHFIGPAYSYTK